MNESVIINGAEYKIGQKVSWKDNHTDHKIHTGTIKFGIYDDDEGYSTQEHIGFYVEYPSNYSDDPNTLTLIDCVKSENFRVL